MYAMTYPAKIYLFLQKKREFLLLFLFTCFTILVRGYEYGLGNQIHYLTYLSYKIDPTLYPSDYLLKTHTIPYTVYMDFLSFLPVIAASREIPMFILYVLLLYCFYLSIFYVTFEFFQSKKISWIIVFLLIAAIPIGGSSITTIEKELDPRFIGEALLFPALYFLAKKRAALSAVFAAAGFLFHPLTLLPYPIIIVILLQRGYLSLKKALIGLGVFTIGIFPLLSRFSQQQQHAGFFIDSSWKSVLIERMPYIFALRWAWYDLVLVAGIPVFFFLYPRIVKKPVHPLVIASVIIGLGLFCANIVSDLFSLRIGLELQLTRNLYLPVIFVYIYCISGLYELFKGRFRKGVLGALFLLILIVALRARTHDGIAWVRPLTDFEKIAYFARAHTDENSIFLVPPSSSGFRFASKRSVVVENKEGGDSLYDRKLAMEWDRRQDELEKNYDTLTLTQVTSFQKEYRIDYLLSRSTLPYTIVYQSGMWKLYKL